MHYHCHCPLFFMIFQSGQFSEDMIPTVGFNMRKITKGNVTIKVGTPYDPLEVLKAPVHFYKRTLTCVTFPSPLPAILTHSRPQLWDIGGQPRFRSMWERYCRGVSAIV